MRVVFDLGGKSEGVVSQLHASDGLGSAVSEEGGVQTKLTNLSNIDQGEIVRVVDLDFLVVVLLRGNRSTQVFLGFVADSEVDSSVIGRLHKLTLDGLLLLSSFVIIMVFLGILSSSNLGVSLILACSCSSCLISLAGISSLASVLPLGVGGVLLALGLSSLGIGFNAFW